MDIRRATMRRFWLPVLMLALSLCGGQRGLGLVTDATAIPPLTEPQQAQLATARDFEGSIDEPALYPLLENAQRWLPGDESGARVPDYKALIESPAENRGELFLIEGILGQAPKPYPGDGHRLSRPGPWEDRMEQWAIVVDRNPDRVAVVYLVAPPTEQERPRAGRPVRMAARFYKAWQFDDLEGQPTTYPVFVGHSLSAGPWPRLGLQSGSGDVTGTGGDGGVPTGVKALFALVIVMAVAYFAIFRRLAKRADAGRQARAEAVARRRAAAGSRTGGDAVEEPESSGMSDDPLPPNPVAAMEELERRRARGEDV